MKCFMCNGKIDTKTLTCECGIVFLKRKDEYGTCYSVDYSNQKTQEAMEQYEEE